MKIDEKEAMNLKQNGKKYMKRLGRKKMYRRNVIVL